MSRLESRRTKSVNVPPVSMPTRCTAAGFYRLLRDEGCAPTRRGTIATHIQQRPTHMGLKAKTYWTKGQKKGPRDAGLSRATWLPSSLRHLPQIQATRAVMYASGVPDFECEICESSRERAAQSLCRTSSASA